MKNKLALSKTILALILSSLLITSLARAEGEIEVESETKTQQISLPNANFTLIAKDIKRPLQNKGGWQPTFKNEQLGDIFTALQNRLSVTERECNTADKVLVAAQLNRTLELQPEAILDISGYSNAVKNCLFNLLSDK